jgi:hypothetical protein
LIVGLARRELCVAGPEKPLDRVLASIADHAPDLRIAA